MVGGIMQSYKRVTGLVAMATLIGGCAANRPVLYPNEAMQRSGSVAAQRQVDECMRLADDYLAGGGADAEAAKDVAGRTAGGAAIGAATGAVGGAIYGDAGKGAAAGAATGATAGLVSGIWDRMTGSGPSPTYKQFVERCLRERGYEAIGWE